MRDHQPIDFNITLSKRPPPSNELPDLKDKTFEFTIREISYADIVNARLEMETNGLIVENVEPAGWAALSGLRQGDILLKINQTPVNDIQEFKKLIDEQVDTKAKSIVFFVRRGIHTLYLEVQPDWKES